MSSSLPKAPPRLIRPTPQPLQPTLLPSTLPPLSTPRPPTRSLPALAPPPLRHPQPPNPHLRRPSSRLFTSFPPRLFTSSPPRPYKTIQQANSRHRSGPFSATAALLFLTAGAGMIWYFRFEKARVERKRVAEAAKGVGRPKVGGEFSLVDQEGGGWDEGRLRGGWSLVYFGFTHCPDICPEELDKMARIIDLVAGSGPAESPPTAGSSHPSTSTPSPAAGPSSPSKLLPIFITCDPARDTPAVLKSYLAEFHPAMVGLTGSWEQVKAVCKAYRVYFSTPPNVKPGQDYLVDHSIYFYLMDPEGDFVEAIGRQHSAEQAARIVREHMGDWKDGVKKG